MIVYHGSSLKLTGDTTVLRSLWQLKILLMMDSRHISGQLLCSPDITKLSRWTFISVNCFLSVTAFFGNALTLIALQTKLLFRCLATTDLCVGLISEPFAITYWMSIMNERTLEDLSLRIQGSLYSRPLIEWSVCVDTDYYKRGQSSRSVVGSEIQTSCNFKANLYDRYYLLDCVRCLFSNEML